MCVTVQYSEGGMAEIHMNELGELAYVLITALDPLRYANTSRSLSTSLLKSSG